MVVPIRLWQEKHLETRPAILLLTNGVGLSWSLSKKDEFCPVYLNLQSFYFLGNDEDEYEYAQLLSFLDPWLSPSAEINGYI